MLSGPASSWLGRLRGCAGCRGIDGPWCPTCAAGVASPAVAARLRPHPEGLGPVVAAAPYAGPLREALVAFKDHGRWSLRAPLGDLLARAVAASALDAGVTTVVLVPVPSAREHTRQRDGDHVRELADRAVVALRRSGLDVRVVRALWPPRRRHDQVGLGRAARAANLAGTLLPTARAVRLHGCAVLLVDDLVTTGATLGEAARALDGVGVTPLGAAVVAATRLPGAGPSAAGVGAPVPPGGAAASSRFLRGAHPDPARATVGLWHPSGSVVASLKGFRSPEHLGG